MIGLLGIAAALFFTGCIVREREVASALRLRL